MARSVLFEGFLHFVRERRLFSRGDKVLAAVSGGPDSVAMLDCLQRLRKSAGIKLFACHLNHLLRGADADADEKFVRDLCAKLEIPLAVKRQDVAAFAKRKHLSTEAAARLARYDFFARAAKRFGCTTIATAHTLSDNAETILQRLIEGAGPAGLSGIPVSRPLDAKGEIMIVRPLLFAPRREVEAYLVSRGLESRIDRTNLEPIYTRNKIRLEILPRILGLNPAAEETISRAGVHIASLMEFVETEIAKAEDSGSSERSRGIVTLDRKALRGLSEFVATEIVKRAILATGVDGRGLTSAGIGSVVSLARGARTYAVGVLPGGAVATVRHERLTIAGPKAAKRSAVLRGKTARATKAHDRRVASFEAVLAVPGRVRLPGGKAVVTAKLVRGFDLRKFIATKTRFEEVIDADSVEGQLVVRFAKPGERFRPLGAPGERKLSDFFTDAKIPREERGAIPLVADEIGIVWVAGLRIAERVRVTPATKRFLKLALR